MGIWNVVLTVASMDHTQSARREGEEFKGGQIAPALTCGVENTLYVFEIETNINK